RKGLFRSEAVTGGLQAQRTVAAGDVSLKVYVTVSGRPARLGDLQATPPAASRRTGSRQRRWTRHPQLAESFQLLDQLGRGTGGDDRQRLRPKVSAGRHQHLLCGHRLDLAQPALEVLVRQSI